MSISKRDEFFDSDIGMFPFSTKIRRCEPLPRKTARRGPKKLHSEIPLSRVRRENPFSHPRSQIPSQDETDSVLAGYRSLKEAADFYKRRARLLEEEGSTFTESKTSAERKIDVKFDDKLGTELDIGSDDELGTELEAGVFDNRPKPVAEPEWVTRSEAPSTRFLMKKILNSQNKIGNAIRELEKLIKGQAEQQAFVNKWIISELIEAEKERFEAEKERFEAEKERHAAERERGAAGREREAAELERYAAQRERDYAERERGAAAKEREASQKERKEARLERAAINEERSLVERFFINDYNESLSDDDDDDQFSLVPYQ